MKLFIAAILVALIGVALCASPEIKEQALKCAEKHNVKPEDVKAAVRGKITGDAVTSDMKCFALCVGEASNIIKDGAFQPDGLAQYVEASDKKELLDKISSECSVKGTDDCDTAFKVFSCISKNKQQSE